MQDYYEDILGLTATGEGDKILYADGTIKISVVSGN